MSSPVPNTLCIFRLSALGDVTHVLPLVRRVQKFWPDTRITWIIGRFEHRLVGDIAGIEFIIVDKKAGWAAWKQLRQQLHGRHFDVLLQCQLSLRANFLGSAVRAKTRVGFDAARSKELHSWFINRRIAPATRQHVLDAIASFGDAIGLAVDTPQWNIPCSDADHRFAAEHLPGAQPTLIISPCSSHRLRNWHAAGYAAVADHAIKQWGMRVLLCGGPSTIEREMADEIKAASAGALIDLVGKDTLKQLLAMLQRATALLSPDSGPMHLAGTVGTPVIGLHAATDAERSGPWRDRRWSVNRYAEAAQKFFHKPATALRWGARVERPGVMDLIRVDAVIERLDSLMRSRQSAG